MNPVPDVDQDVSKETRMFVDPHIECFTQNVDVVNDAMPVTGDSMRDVIHSDNFLPNIGYSTPYF